MVVQSASAGAKFVKKDWEFQSVGHLKAFTSSVRALDEHGATAKSLFAQLRNGGHAVNLRDNQASGNLGMGSGTKGCKTLGFETLGVCFSCTDDQQMMFF